MTNQILSDQKGDPEAGVRKVPVRKGLREIVPESSSSGIPPRYVPQPDRTLS